MKAIYSIPVVTLALVIALVAKAEPAPGGAPGTARYNPKELSVDKIQSPRDTASRQANGFDVTFQDIVISSATANVGGTVTTEIGHRTAAPQQNPAYGRQPNGWFAPELDSDQSGMVYQRSKQPGASGNFDAPKLDADSGLEIVSPRDSASGQATSVTSAEGRSMSFELYAVGNGSAKQPSNDAVSLGDTGTHEVGYRSAAPAGDAPAEIYANNIGGGLLGVQAAQADAETYREGGVNDQTARTKKPRRNRNGKRGKRMYKP